MPQVSKIAANSDKKKLYETAPPPIDNSEPGVKTPLAACAP